MTRTTDHDESGRGHPVRPRWTWCGLTLVLVGLAAVGFGMGVGFGTSRAWIAAGLVVAAVGAAAALRGGLLYDLHSSSPMSAEIHDVATGEEHLGPDPSSRLQRAGAQEEAREADARLRRIQEQTAASKPRLIRGRHR